MALDLRLTVPTRNNMMDEITALVDAGAAAGRLKIYTTPRPAGPANAATGTLLVDIPLSDPSFAAAVAGTIVGDITPALSAAAVATGTAAYFRLEDSNGNGVTDGDVGTTGSDLNLNTTAITSGVNVEVTQLDLTAGNA